MSWNAAWKICKLRSAAFFRDFPWPIFLCNTISLSASSCNHQILKVLFSMTILALNLCTCWVSNAVEMVSREQAVRNRPKDLMIVDSSCWTTDDFWHLHLPFYTAYISAKQRILLLDKLSWYEWEMHRIISVHFCKCWPIIMHCWRWVIPFRISDSYSCRSDMFWIEKSWYNFSHP